jgi:CheY-like chemotaxis protein
VDELYANLPQQVLKNLSVILVHSTANDHDLNDVIRRYDLAQSIVKPITANKLLTSLGRMRKRFDLKNDVFKQNQDTVSSHAFKLLIVDDNEINLLLAKNVMQLLLPNANIMECLSAEEALEHLTEFQPEFVLMDIQMPGMSGYEATKHIRELIPDKHIPIIALTAGVSQKDRDKSKQAGLDDFVSKPLRIDEIKELIKKHLLYEGKNHEVRPKSVQQEQSSNELKHVNLAAILSSVGDDKALYTEFITFLKQGSFDSLYTDAIQIFSHEKLDSNLVRSMLHRLLGVAASAKFEILSEKIHVFRNARDTNKKNLQEFLLPIVDELNFLKEYIQTL